MRNTEEEDGTEANGMNPMAVKRRKEGYGRGMETGTRAV